MSTLKYGDFNELSRDYSYGRKGQTSKVIDYCSKLIEASDSKLVLDLACGTGIPTRQLTNKTKVLYVGLDKSADMLHEALKQKSRNVSYVLANSSEIPFGSNTFDAITVFGAFHWIAFTKREQSMKEISRVLKKGGLLIISNKNDTNSFSENIKNVIKKYTTKPFPEVRKNYYPEKILKQSGFRNITINNFKSTETFTEDELLKYAQSMSAWNIVDESKKTTALNSLGEYFKSKHDNVIVRELTTTVISGSNVK